MGEPTDVNGLVYLRARYYNPTIGQFFKLDPMETPNRYRYVGANPVNFHDPSGLQFPGVMIGPRIPQNDRIENSSG
jgi:RHS repeat-associated protein